MPKYQISAILCHHKGELIDKAIESIQKSLEVEVEIIVATSDTLSLERLEQKYPNHKIFLAQGGPALKRNVATRYASYDLLAFFDDDIEVTPYALFYMAESLKNDVGMVYGKLLNMEFHDKFDEAGSYLTDTGFLLARAESGIKDAGQFEKIEPILSGKSASCLVKRSIFWEVGGFDASYEILGEETDLSWRIWLSGRKVLFVPKSVTFHAFNTKFKPADFYTPKRVYFNGCRNYLSMLITNLEYHNLAIPILIQTIVWFTAALGMLITGKSEAGFNILRGLRVVFTNLSSILAKRHKVQSHRKISDKELFKFIKRNPPIFYYINRFFHYIKTGRHG